MIGTIEQDAPEPKRSRKGLPLPSHIETAPADAPVESVQPVGLIQPAKMPPITGMFGPDNATGGNGSQIALPAIDKRITAIDDQLAALERERDRRVVAGEPLDDLKAQRRALLQQKDDLIEFDIPAEKVAKAEAQRRAKETKDHANCIEATELLLKWATLRSEVASLEAQITPLVERQRPLAERWDGALRNRVSDAPDDLRPHSEWTLQRLEAHMEKLKGDEGKQ